MANFTDLPYEVSTHNYTESHNDISTQDKWEASTRTATVFEFFNHSEIQNELSTQRQLESATLRAATGPDFYNFSETRNESFTTENDLLNLNLYLGEKLLPVTIYVSLLMFLGLTGNSVVVYVYLCKWKSITIKYFIGYLATLDLITSGLCMPLELAMHVNPITQNSDALCKILRFSRGVTSLAEGFMLVVIAFDRFLRVCRYTKKQIDVRMAKRLCLTSAVVSVCLSWPSIILSGNFDRKNKYILQTSCSTAQSILGTIYPMLYYGMMIAIFFIVAVCLFIFYILVGIRLHRLPSKSKLFRNGNKPTSRPVSADASTVNLETNSLKKPTKNKDKPLKRKSSFVDIAKVSVNFNSLRRNSTRLIRRQKPSLTLFIITMLAVISYLPYIVLMIRKFTTSNFLESLTESQQVWFNIGMLSHFLGNGFNPFIYGFFSKDFRRKCRSLLRSMTNNSKDNTTRSSTGTDKRISCS